MRSHKKSLGGATYFPVKIIEKKLLISRHQLIRKKRKKENIGALSDRYPDAE